jgi:ATP-dependent Lhr-like helicase
VQASAELFYDVFSRYDPGNLLLRQAEREVLERALEASRLKRTSSDCAATAWSSSRSSGRRPLPSR